MKWLIVNFIWQADLIIGSTNIITLPLSMNSDEIEKFLKTKEVSAETYVKIDFPKRNSLYGLFIKDADYNDLKAKNFWRIVTRQHFDQWKEKKDINLAKIFNGAEFSRLTLYKDSF